MEILTVVAIYFVVWWITLFAVLPLGVEPDDAHVPGQDRGAPKAPKLGRKAAINSVVAAVVTAIIIAAVEYFRPS